MTVLMETCVSFSYLVRVGTFYGFEELFRSVLSEAFLRYPWVISYMERQLDPVTDLRIDEEIEQIIFPDEPLLFPLS